MPRGGTKLSESKVPMSDMRTTPPLGASGIDVVEVREVGRIFRLFLDEAGGVAPFALTGLRRRA